MIALTRPVPDAIVRCELTHLERVPIDVGRARAEHAAYEQVLREEGIAVRALPAAMDLPDSVFVEDTAVVLDEVAVLTRPGAASRRGELPAVREALTPLRPLREITAPATLDGGDVLVLGRELVVGLGTRTNPEGAAALRAIVAPFGYTVRTLPIRAALHLKSAVTRAGPDLLVVNPDWVDADAFPGWRVVGCDPAEPFGANVLWLGGATVVASQHPRTAARLAAAGCRIRHAPAGELAKAEGGVTCCSLLVRAGRSGPAPPAAPSRP